MSQSTYLTPPYSTDDSGRLHLYEGPLNLTAKESAQVIQGRVFLELIGRTMLKAELNIEDVVFAMDLAIGDQGVVVSIPDDANLTAPSPIDASSRSDGQMHEETINRLVAGDVSDAVRIKGHVLGPLTDHPFPTVQTPSGPQGQLAFQLGAWNVRLARIDKEQVANSSTAFVFEADTPDTFAEDSVDRFRSDLFALLSFAANVEIGVGPIVAVDESGQVVWVELDAPRTRARSGVIRWCPSHLVAKALPLIADGITALGRDPTMARVVDRSVQHLLVAPGPEVLDVRIPTICSGLELLSWAVIRREGWVTADTSGQLSAGARARLAAQWAGLDTAIPPHMTALVSRARRLGQSSMEAPEIVYNIRNGLVHPPKSLDAPEWPRSEELTEAWLLATWLLEMLLLRTIGYEGQYWSRLRLGRSAWEIEPVPWMSTAS